MLPTIPTNRPGARRRPLLAISVAGLIAAGALAGCSTSGGSDSSNTTAAKKTTTTEKTTTTAEETTTTGASSGDVPSVDDLTSILPPASKVGEGWTGPTKTPKGDDSISNAIKAQCPDASLGDDSDPEVDVTYDHSNGTSLEISFDRTMDDVKDGDAAKVVAAVNKCADVNYTDPSDGTKYVIDLAAQEDPGIGDQGAKLAAHIKATTSAGKLIDFYTYDYAIVRGGVGISIVGTDGVADDGTV